MELTISDLTPTRVEHTLRTLFPDLNVAEAFAVSSGDNAWSLRVKTDEDTYIDPTEQYIHLYATLNGNLKARRLTSLHITFTT